MSLESLALARALHVSLITIAGAVAGSHGWLAFG